MTVPTTTAWAIKAPDGHVIIDTVASSMGGSWRAQCDPMDVKLLQARGYRCVKVQITEAQE